MKKKGFTLIELLAVIVILAIIALIATPLVLKYIGKAKVESTEISSESIRKAALNYLASEQLKGNIDYPVTVDVQDLQFNGKEDYSGKVVIYKDGTVEEFVDNKDYVISNGQIINKKEPYLKAKEGQTAVIDDKNKIVYSFWNNDTLDTNYNKNYLTLDVLTNIFEIENGTIEFVTNGSPIGPYSTGAKIIIKDIDGNINKEYEIVIFGDVDSNGLINSNDVGKVNNYVNQSVQLTSVQTKAADINRDNVVDKQDTELILNLVSSGTYNQITNKLS